MLLLLVAVACSTGSRVVSLQSVAADVAVKLRLLTTVVVQHLLQHQFLALHQHRLLIAVAMQLRLVTQLLLAAVVCSIASRVVFLQSVVADAAVLLLLPTTVAVQHLHQHHV
jgi:hypothetical protein